MCHRVILLFFVSLSLLSKLYGQIPNFDDENESLFNNTIWDLIKPQSNPYLQELSGHWSFNDTVDISKYEEFDHTRFEAIKELSLEELVAKVKERAKTKIHQPPTLTQPTPPPDDLPIFDSNMMTNTTVQLGGIAYLHCRVRNLNNGLVSWIRRSDWHILTSATLMFISDERFNVLHAEGSEDWTLQIKFAQKKDAGAYECQVSDRGRKISHFFNLDIVIPTAYILGSGEYHIGQGSTISLVCVIENSPSPPQYVMWYHNDKMINYEESTRDDGRVQVVTDSSGEKTQSRLLITEATSSHSGNYTCRASNTEPDSVHVFVSTDGDNIAAIQRQDASESLRPCVVLILITTTLFQ